MGFGGFAFDVFVLLCDVLVRRAQVSHCTPITCSATCASSSIYCKVQGVSPPWGQTLTSHFRSNVLQMVSFYWGEHPPLQALSRTKVHGGNWLFTFLAAKTLWKCYIFTWTSPPPPPSLPCAVLLADSSTVLVRLCGTCILYTPTNSVKS